MPAPKPPVIERFQLLVGELTAELERLHYQNADLLRQNSELLASGKPASAGLVVTPPRGTAVATTKRGSADFASELAERTSIESSFGQPRKHAVTRSSFEEFQRLDFREQGRLYIDDLVRILQSADEPYEYSTLINSVRSLNGLEPLKYNRSTESWRSTTVSLVTPQRSNPPEASLSLDYQAYLRLMDDHASYEHLDSSTAKCVKSLRDACHQAVQHWDAIDGFLSTEKTRAPRWTEFWLETIPTIVILCNTVVIGLSADHQEYDFVWQACEYAFASFYLVESVAKMGVFGVREYFYGPQGWWNIFDLFCLLITLVDFAVTLVLQTDSDSAITETLKIIKIFRLTRLARLVRTLRFRIFHELKLMVMGVFSGLRVLTWAIVLFVILLYVFGVGLTNVLEVEEFESVGVSMFTLFRCWTEGCSAKDGTPLAENLRHQYGPLWMVFHILSTMFIIVGVFNLIMAVFIDNVVTAQTMRRYKEMISKSDEIESKFKNLFLSFILRGVDGKRLRPESARMSVSQEWEKMRAENVNISHDIFKEWLHNEDFQNLLDEAEIETAHSFELFEVLDADMTGELSLDELTTGLMKLRGPVTKSDIVAVRLKVRHLTQALDKGCFIPPRTSSQELCLHNLAGVEGQYA